MSSSWGRGRCLNLDESDKVYIKTRIEPKHHLPHVPLIALQEFQNSSKLGNKGSKLSHSHNYKNKSNQLHSNYINKRQRFKNSRIRTCSLCSKQFTSIFFLTFHFKTQHGNLRNSSPIRSTRTESKRHKNQVNSIKVKSGTKIRRRFTCYFCQKIFRLHPNLNSHLKRIHGQSRNTSKETIPAESLICLFCGYQAYSLSTLNRHNRSHTEELPYSCSKCGVAMRYECSMYRHMKKCKGTGSKGGVEAWERFRNGAKEVKEAEAGWCNKCPECPETFRLPGHKRTHMQCHGTALPCPYCPAGFNLSEALQKHERKFHPKQTKFKIPRPWAEEGRKAKAELKCAHCAQTFLRLNDKSNHERSHGTKYSCPLCPAGFVDRKPLNRHIKRLHTPDLNQVGILTDTAYQHKQLYYQGDTWGNGKGDPPVKLTEVKDFKCPKCSQKFATDKSRRSHVRSHGDKFPCPFCPTGFKSSTGLRLHKTRCHRSKIATWKCTVCQMRFCGKSSLGRHHRVMHPPEQAKQKSDDIESDINLVIVKPRQSVRRSRVNGDAVLIDPLSPTASLNEMEVNGGVNDSIRSWITSTTNKPATELDPVLYSVPELIPTTVLKMES